MVEPPGSITDPSITLTAPKTIHGLILIAQACGIRQRHLIYGLVPGMAFRRNSRGASLCSHVTHSLRWH